MSAKLIKAVLYFDDGTAQSIEGAAAIAWADALADFKLRMDGADGAANLKLMSAWKHHVGLPDIDTSKEGGA